MKKFKVLLPIQVDGKVYQHGSVIELDAIMAKLYSHAITACEEEEDKHGGNS